MSNGGMPIIIYSKKADFENAFLKQGKVKVREPQRGGPIPAQGNALGKRHLMSKAL